MSGKLSGKVALITGGSRGIGRAAALAFAREGAALIGVHFGANTDAAAATIREIERPGAKAVAIKADLRGGKEATDRLWEQFSRTVSARATPSGARHPTKAPLFRAAFLQGISTNIANPKSIAFYAAVFSSAVPTHVSMPTFFAVLATVGATATCWYGAVALVLSHAAIATAYRRAKAWIDLTCGGLMIALGIRQALR
ncbi:LysE family transporter [Paraburkholderia oxyphila]|uniref:LysE family transporter n=1 Tax=Paraburkholderia oxyphila TaxID=614212 RepID=UPI000A00E9C9|nr:LysE family transporter [Paraburkholderia oxyphila]